MSKNQIEETIEELCRKAKIKKPYQYSSWVFMRALGNTKEAAAPSIGISERTLTRYEKQAKKYLEPIQRALLIKLAFEHEFNERIDLEKLDYEKPN